MVPLLTSHSYVVLSHALRYSVHNSLAVAVILMLAPHPSLLIVLVNYHLRVLNSPAQFLTHLVVTYTLTFISFSSLILILARDPGPAVGPKMTEAAGGQSEDMDFMQALLTTEEDEPEVRKPGKWCRKCSAPKPERTHHCSSCGRCVLKMGKRRVSLLLNSFLTWCRKTIIVSG